VDLVYEEEACMGETKEKHVGNNIGVHVAKNRGAFSVLASGNSVCALVYFNLDVAGDTNVGSGPWSA
jgi:hypothetical protein